MNAKQKEKIRSLIQNDAKIRYNYYDQGETCVIGCLLLEAKVELAELAIENNCPITRLPFMLRILKSEYGIDRDLAYTLQKANDGETEIESRRTRLLRIIDSVRIEE